MRPWRAVLCLLAGAWALACGGRYQQTTGGNDAGSSSAGSTSGGGGSATGGSGPICQCDPIACDPPFHAVPQVDGCCDYCELDLIQCARSTDDYRQFRQQMIDKYNSLGCMNDLDCTIYADGGLCGAGSCGFPLLGSMLNEVDRNLKSYAMSSCSPACPEDSSVPCKPSGQAHCVMNRCL